MSLFNKIQVIKCGVRRMFNWTYWLHDEDTAQQDIKLLTAMCEEVHVLVASNGRKYWYYFPDRPENIDVSRYLMERNGVVPTFRMSRNFAGWGNHRPAFRLSIPYLLNHPEQNKFVKQIQERDYRTIEEVNLQQQISAIRNQMRQK